MAKTVKRHQLTTEEKLYKAIQALFIMQARQLDLGNDDMRRILGVEKAEVNAVAKLVNKALRKNNG